MALIDIAFFIAFTGCLLLLGEVARLLANYLTRIRLNDVLANLISFGVVFATVNSSFFIKQHHLEKLRKGW